MAQHDYNLANQSGADFRADLNNALSAIATTNSGATSPSTTFAHQLWVDTANSVLKIRNSANDAWITTGVSITADNTFDINGGTVNGITSFSFSTGSTVTSILDEDDLSSDSATALATQQSIKAYVDSQVGSVDTLAEILLNGNTTGGTDIEFGDNDKAIFGTGSDLSIYHSGTNSHIADTGEGNLYLDATNLIVRNGTGTETYMTAANNGGVVLYHDNTSRFSTTSSGIDVTGTVVSDGLTVDGVASIDAGGNNAHTIGRLIIDYASSGNPKLMSEGGDEIAIVADLNIVGGEVIKSTTQPSHFNFKQARTGYDIAFYTSPTANNTFVKALEIDANGDISFYDDTGTTQGLFWDASTERLGIGTTSPSRALSVEGKIFLSGDGQHVYFGGNNTFIGERSNSTHLQLRGGGNSNAQTVYIDNNGRLGLGTASPSEKLHVIGGAFLGSTTHASDSRVTINGSVGGISNALTVKNSSASTSGRGTRINLASSNTEIGRIEAKTVTDSTSGSLSLSTASSGSLSTALFIDSSQRVGIGTTAPQGNLHVEGAAGASGGGIIYVTDADNGSTASDALQISKSGDTAFIYNRETLGNLQLGAGGNANHIIVRTDGKVGIGTTSPQTLLHISGANPEIRLSDTTNTNYNGIKNIDGNMIYMADSGSQMGNSRHRWEIDGSEKARLDSSGNLLVGKTSVGTQYAGFEARANGVTGCTANSLTPLIIDRRGNDGQLLSFKNDGVEIGEFSVKGTSLILGYQSTAIRFQDGNTRLAPFSLTTNGINDAAIDIGYSGGRFKDLYLSGTLTNDGTGGISIDTSGNVGIGTTSPSTALDVTGTVTSDALTVSNGTNTTSIPTTSDRVAFTGAYLNYVQSAGNLFIQPTGDLTLNGSGSEIMRLKDGKVGIGTNSPSKILHISDTTDSCQMMITSSNTTTAGIIFGDSDDSATGHILYNHTDDALAFGGYNNTERMRIDSSGNLLVSTTTNPVSSSGVTGLYYEADNYLAVATAGITSYFNRQGSDGDITHFRKNGTSVGSIGVSSGTIYIDGGTGSTGLYFGSSNIYPRDNGAAVDDAVDIGHASYRFQDIYASNGTIQTSDINEKQDIEDLSEAETRVAIAAKGLLKKYRWKSAVADKGDDARIHFGIMAQDLENAFANEGLDAGDYGMFISTTWTDEATGEEKTRLGVRYNELLAFIIAAI